MFLPILLLMTSDGPTLEQARTCRAHMELFIEEVAAESEHVAGPTWFIRGWWERQAIEAGAPEDDASDLDAGKAALAALKVTDPEAFGAERQACIDTAIDAGAVPGMGPE